MRSFIAFQLSLLLIVASSAAPTQSTKSLDIYLVDVEGGNATLATLVVSPSGESLLIDTGNVGAAKT